jgi:single-strand DNA-binding protein
MKRDLNNLTISGNVGKEVKISTGKTTVANFSLANHYDNNTSWFNVVAFGKLAEICDQYLTSGREVLIEGRLSSSPWTDRNNSRRNGVKIIATSIKFLGSRKG